MEVEQEVIKSFAPLYGFSTDEVWGLVSASGTDGNNHGLYFGRHYLVSKTGAEPVLYVSTESHYSNMRLAELQQMEVRLIPTDEMAHDSRGIQEGTRSDKARACRVLDGDDV